MGNRFGKRRFANPERLCGNRHAASLQCPRREPESLIDATEHLIVRDGDVEIEIHAAEPADAQGVCARGARDPGRLHWHQKRRHALAAQAGTRAGEHDGHSGALSIGHPHFPAANAVAVTGADRRRLLVGGVGARVRLRQRKRADHLAAREPAQPAFTLLIAAGMGD